jgi:hypothetical protein
MSIRKSKQKRECFRRICERRLVLDYAVVRLRACASAKRPCGRDGSLLWGGGGRTADIDVLSGRFESHAGGVSQGPGTIHSEIRDVG